MRKYRLVAKKGEGTFSEVLKAQNVKDGKYHAIKCMKNRFESIDQVNNLREIQALRRLSPHEHIISLEEVLYDQPTGRLALVFELMDANLYELIRGRKHYLNPSLIKSYMWQLMKSLDHMHKKGIFHRDIKPENILIESSTEIGRGLKLADFGSCRGIYSKQPYTEYISTRWYRAPECLLTDGYYGPEMDLWGAGCVMFEITSLYPLFPGANEVDQISRIHKVLGTPSAESLAKFRSKGASHISFDFPAQKGIGIPQLVTHASPDSIDLMIKLLKYDASDRITAREAMRHNYFKDVREAEAKQTAEKQQATTSTNAAPSSQPSGAPVGSLSSNSSVANTDYKQQQPGVSQSNHYQYANENANASKNLPNIQASGNVTEQKSIMGSNASNHDLQLQYQQQQLLAKQQSQNAKMGMPLASTIAASSLPPIMSSNMNASQQGKYVEQKSAKTMQPSVNSQSQKRRKKYKMNYVQQQRGVQNSEQVMKTYGASKLIGSSGGASMVLDGNNNNNKGGTSASEKGGGGGIGVSSSSANNSGNTYGLMVGPSGGAQGGGPSSNVSGAYGHPSRNYVQQKK